MATEYTESINAILRDTLPDLPGVVRSVAEQEFRLAAREFFERSFAWTVIIPSADVPIGDTAIQLDDGDENTEVIGILGVKKGTIADGFERMTPLGREPDKIEGSESPRAWYVTSNPDELKLHPYQQSATSDVLRVNVALIPAFDIDASITSLPRQITLKFYDALRNGFLARMYSQPAKPYSNPREGQNLRQNFIRQIGYYAAQRKKGFNNSPQWSFPTGWRPRMRGAPRGG